VSAWNLCPPRRITRSWSLARSTKSAAACRILGLIRSLKADGTKDTTFGVTNGAATATGGTNYSLAYAAAPQLDGKVLVVWAIHVLRQPDSESISTRLTATGAEATASFRTDVGSALTSKVTHPERRLRCPRSQTAAC